MAQRKVLSLLESGAKVRIISPQLTAVLNDIVRENRAEWLNRGYCCGDLAGAFLVFAATDNREIQQAVVRDAKQAGLPVNVADDPAQCSFQVPAVVRRGDLSIAVSTNGKSPALAAKLREQLDRQFGEEYIVLLRLMACLRKQLRENLSDSAVRKILFQNVLHDDIISWIRNEQWDVLDKHLAAVIGSAIDLDVRQLTGNR